MCVQFLLNSKQIKINVRHHGKKKFELETHCAVDVYFVYVTHGRKSGGMSCRIPEGPVELLFGAAAGGDVYGEEELLEVDVSVLVAVEGAEHVITELVGVPRGETFGVDLWGGGGGFKQLITEFFSDSDRDNDSNEWESFKMFSQRRRRNFPDKFIVQDPEPTKL
jgi:hypothetical protein